jgi:large subunit ribosomal protein L4
MSKLPVKNISGDRVGEFDVPDALLIYDKGAQAVHEAVLAHRVNVRAGTASTLGKGAVAGSGKKPWKQKGTGRARAGYQQSPVWRGGGVAFGPKPRVLEQKLPKKVARLAFRRAFSEKISAGEVTVLDSLTLEAPRTKTIADLMKSLEAYSGALIVLDAADKNISLAVRNIPDVAVTTASHVHTYELLRYPQVLVTKAGMDVLTQRLQQSVSGRAA